MSESPDISKPDFLVGDDALESEIASELVEANSDGVDVGSSQERYDLPSRTDFLDSDFSINSTSVERFLEELESDESYDVSASDPVRLIGDGKNIYKLRRDDGFDDMPRKVDDIWVECVGVCNPEMYEDILEGEGFDGVLDYVDGRHRDAIHYDPEDGEFIYHPDDFSSNAADSTVEDALDDYERIDSD